MTFTTEEALAHLGQMVAADTAPTLNATEVAELLDLYTVRDTDGEVIRYDFARAAAQGWRIKAGRASGCVDVAADGIRLSKHQLFAACMDLAARYGQLDAGSTLVLTVGTNPATPDPNDQVVLI